MLKGNPRERLTMGRNSSGIQINIRDIINENVLKFRYKYSPGSVLLPPSVPVPSCVNRLLLISSSESSVLSLWCCFSLSLNPLSQCVNFYYIITSIYLQNSVSIIIIICSRLDFQEYLLCTYFLLILNMITKRSSITAGLLHYPCNGFRSSS